FTDLDIPEDATGRLPLSKRTRAGLAAEDAEDLGDKRRSRSSGSDDGGSGRSRTRKPRKRTRGAKSSGSGDDAQATGEGAENSESGSGRSRSRRRTRGGRSEEHTSELQSRENLVCRLLLEKKKRKRGHHQELSVIKPEGIKS